MLILISPPETEAEEKKIWLGNTDSKLSEAGREEAIDFARRDMWINPHRVYIGPAEHTKEFTTIVLPFAKPVVVDGFADRSMGSLTGRDYRETMKEFPRRNWLAWQRSYWTPAPEGESLFDISDRVLTAFRTKILPIEAAENVAVIVTPDVMRLLIGYLRKDEETEIPKISIEPVIPYVVNGKIA